ncbi:hypothetical protein HanPI659440_Chr05g0186641 [Helianthus annuus]|nr:hypothetical protein HanPI659440_Chr05g0186641 [Helianthus annuus]
MLGSSRVSGQARVHMSNPIQSGFKCGSVKHQDRVRFSSVQQVDSSDFVSWFRLTRSDQVNSINSVDPVNSVNLVGISTLEIGML